MPRIAFYDDSGGVCDDGGSPSGLKTCPLASLGKRAG